jgi:hypothetical protein
MKEAFRDWMRLLVGNQEFLPSRREVGLSSTPTRN